MAKGKVTKEYKTVPLSSLVEFEDNPQQHPEEQIKILAESIDRYTQYYPIVVDENMRILCGHGKKRALEYKGETMADVVILRGLSEKEKKKIVLEDNKIQNMSYLDYKLVEDLIHDIEDVDILGFSTDYLEAIINQNSPTDNEGVDLHAPIERKTNEEQVAQIPEERKEKQDNELEDFEAGMVKPHTIVCPHCGKEITL